MHGKQSTAHLGGVAGDEVVHGLLAREPRHRRQHAERVAAQQDQVLGVRAHAGDARVVDVLDRVRRARVLRHRAAQARHSKGEPSVVRSNDQPTALQTFSLLMKAQSQTTQV